ncbi:MAG: Rad52/Rad22 family DNA repair protein [Terriglobales bacterium]
MTPPNGHATGSTGRLGDVAPSAPVVALTAGATRQFTAEEIRHLVTALEVPFDPSQIDWRVTNTSKNGSPPRGQVVPYADPRAYIDRLNLLVTPAGWTRKYVIHTSATFQRDKDQRVVAKVLVACELTIFGLGSNSATGEEWADDDNACTSAEAQAFKRACTSFGLGRYLYYYAGTWVDLDERKRPKTVPALPAWATPEGWRQGIRPQQRGDSPIRDPLANAKPGTDGRPVAPSSLILQIEAMAEPLGKRMYRGLLKRIARVWNPRDIQDAGLQQQVLAHMQAAERGFRRVDAALERVEPEALTRVLRSLKLQSIDRVDNLQTLREIVLALETAAEGRAVKQ